MAAFRRLLDLIAELLSFGGVDLLVEIVIDQNNRRRAATRKAFHELNGDFAIRRNLSDVGVELFLELRTSCSRP